MVLCTSWATGVRERFPSSDGEPLFRDVLSVPGTSVTKFGLLFPSNCRGSISEKNNSVVSFEKIGVDCSEII